MATDTVEAQLAVEQAEVDRVRTLYELRRQQVADLRVRAGMPGVLQQVPLEEGQRITTGANLARVGDPTVLKAELRVAETQAKDIQIGQSAAVDTRNGVIPSHVTRIDPAVENGTVTVDVALDGELPRGARPDLTVDGTIELERMDDVLFVGRPVFGQEESMVSLFRVEADGTHASRMRVSLGRASVNTIEVLEGLQPGDRVVLSDMSTWDLEGAIHGALDRRTDVSRARRQLDANEATVDNLRNSTLPALDLVGSYQLSGQGGPRRVPAGNSFEDIFAGAGGVIPGGYRDALQSVANADYPVWCVQLQMTYPLGHSADRAAYERARLELQQNRAQIRRIELRIASEVTNAALRIESIRERIDAATASRELAKEQLQAEESKFEMGLSTNFFVLLSQRDLATAQDAELRAILDYQRALIEFERTQRASLGGAGIALVGSAIEGGPRGSHRRRTVGAVSDAAALSRAGTGTSVRKENAR